MQTRINSNHTEQKIDWAELAAYRCPKDRAHLELIRVRKLFVCSNERCTFAVRQDKRAEIAAKYPNRVSRELKAVLENVLSFNY